jgi:hypothetical protein
VFRTYVDLGSVRLLKERLALAGVTSKTGRPLGRGPLFHMLQNSTYRGEIAHKGAVYSGEHAAIIDPELWDAVQQSLAANRYDRATGARAGSPSLLAGLLFDHMGAPMTATHAVKGGKRYRYYVSRRLITETRDASPGAQRIPAGDLEQLVADRLRRWLNDRQELFTTLRQAAALPPGAEEQHRLIRKAEQLAQRWSALSTSEQRGILRSVFTRVEVHQDRIEAHLSPPELRTLLLGDPLPALASAPAPSAMPLVLSVPATLRRAGREMALLIEGSSPPPEPNPALIKLIAKAHGVGHALTNGHFLSVAAYAEREGLSKSYVARLVRLVYLAPPIVTAILDGRQPPKLTATRLMQDTRLPLAWAEQEHELGFS